MKVGAIIQARLGSERFPGKVLQPLPVDGGLPVLEHIARRAGRASAVDAVVVATSDQEKDDPIAEFFSGDVFRGDEEDVLGRIFHCAKSLGLTTVVRLTGDNPCLDPQKLEEVVQHHLREEADYTASAGLPLGMNLEVVSMRGLEVAHREGTDPYDREHVTPFLRRNPERFRLREIEFEVPEVVSGLRLTLDYPSDYAMLNLVFGYFAGREFSLDDLASFVGDNPWVAGINPNPQRKRFAGEEEEYRAAVEYLRRLELNRAASLLEEAGARRGRED